jgi:hypothetical protein
MKYGIRGIIRRVILGGDACDLCYRGSWFESRLGHYLERVFVSSSKKHLGYCLNWATAVPFTVFIINYFSIILLFNAIVCSLGH